MASSGSSPPSETQLAIVRSIPSGMTPVPDGVSVATCSRASSCRSRNSVTMETRAARLPACTTSIAAVVPSTTWRISSMGRAVGPPFRWLATSGWTARVRSASTTFDPGTDAPPICMGTVQPRARPAHHGQQLVGVDDAPQPHLSEQPHASRVHLVEVVLHEAMFEQERTADHLGSPWSQRRPTEARRYRHGLGPGGGPRAPRPVGLTGRDERGDPAVQVTRHPARGVLPGRVVAEHRMGMGVDQSRHDRPAMDVETPRRTTWVDIVAPADGAQLPVRYQQCIALDHGVLEQSRDDAARPEQDQRLAHPCARIISGPHNLWPASSLRIISGPSSSLGLHHLQASIISRPRSRPRPSARGRNASRCRTASSRAPGCSWPDTHRLRPRRRSRGRRRRARWTSRRC